MMGDLSKIQLEIEKTPGNTTFLQFAQELHEANYFGDDEWRSISQSASSAPLLESVKLFSEIEVYFWTSLPLLAGLYTENQGIRLSSDNIGNTIAEFSFLASGLRGTIAYIQSQRRGITTDPDIFALIEIIPYIGRLAPILWLPEHKDYITTYIIFKKDKNSGSLTQEKYESLKTKIHGSLEQLSRIQSVLSSVRNRVYSIISPPYVQNTLAPLLHGTLGV